MPDKIIHQIQVDGYCARFGGKWGRLQLGTFGSYGIEQLQITLGDSWTDLVVYANFVTADGTTPVLVPESGLVDVPPEATAKPGMGNIVLDGTADGVRIYSVNIPYIMLNHSDLSGEAPAPTPDRWEQYVAQVKDDADRAEQAAGAAADSAAAAAKSAEAAAESAKQAEQAGADIGAAKDDALEAIQQAQDTGVQAVQTATTTGVQAVQQAHQAALDDIATDRQQALTDIEGAGDKQTAAITSGGAAALEAIGQVEQAAIGQVQQAGAAQVDAVNAAGNAQLDKINAANALVPTPTQEDAGKSIIVKPDGSGYELGEVQTDAYTKAESDARYAPIEAAIRPTVSGNPATLEHSVAWAMQGLSVYGKSTQVTTAGAQLLPPQLASAVMQDGVTFEPLADGRLRVYGTATKDTSVTGTTLISLSAEAYTLDIGVKMDAAAFRVCMIEPIGVPYLNIKDGNSSSTETLAEPIQAALLVRVYNGQTVDVVLSPLLCSGSTARPWEPYTGGKPSPSPDYPQEIVTAGLDGSIDITVSDGADQSQQLVISTPNGLPGIPVDSGGNYTDASGQQWVCDEVDFEREVYAQRIQKITSYTDEDIDGPYMSTTGQFTTGATVIYVLAAPIESPLSAEELAAYAALRSYNGTTIVSTEAPVAGLSARYVADGAAYIDGKIQAAVTQAVAAAVSLTGGAQ